MATHSSILAWKIPQIEEPGTVHGVTKNQIPEYIHTHTHTHTHTPESRVLSQRIIFLMPVCHKDRMVKNIFLNTDIILIFPPMSRDIILIFT